jgi:hypothetical protein
MEPVFETPDNPVPELQPELFTYLVNVNVQWENFAVRRYVVADLPA